MNKQKVILISVLMGLALIGLISLQVNWIMRDFLLREERFQLQAKEALDKAITKLETKATVHLITTQLNEFIDDSIKAYFLSSGLPGILDQDTIDEIESFKSGNNTFEFHSKSDSFGNSRVEIVSNGDSADEKLVIAFQNDNNQRRKELVIVEEELKHAEKELTLHEQELFELKVQKFKKERKIHKVLSKMAVEYDLKDSMLLERVVPETLDSLIKNEMNNYGIYIPYNVVLTTGKNDSIIWSKLNAGLSTDTGLVVTSSMFPDEIISRNDIVKVFFPETLKYFLSSMWLMLLSSALFTLIIIFAFSYTVIIIFRQKKLSEMKNDFINNMTHEFKTPIATIQLAVNAINNEEVYKDTKKLNYYTEIIKSENQRMNTQVENILQIAQFDKSTFTSNIEVINMHEVIQNSVLMMRLHAEQKGGKINFDANALKFEIKADRRFIPIVILNLLDNAIKYSHNAPSVHITTISDNDLLTINVSDKGIGMSKDRVNKIFEKFYRVPSGDIHNVKGFGLGLSYVKAIVTSHNGTIKVNSDEGLGTEFIITLPLAEK